MSYPSHGYLGIEEDSVAVIHRHQEEEQEKVDILLFPYLSGCVTGIFASLPYTLLAGDQVPYQEQEEAKGEEWW